MLGGVGHVVLGVVRGLTIGADVGTVEGVVPGVPGPAPIVDLPAKYAHARVRGVNQANVAELELLDLKELRALEVGGDPTAHRGFALAAALGERAPAGLHLFPPCLGILDVLEAREDLIADIGEGGCHVDPLPRASPALLRLRLGQEAVLEQVFALAAVARERSDHAVVVGDQQALIADKGGRAPPEADDRTERELDGVGQRGGIKFDAEVRELLSMIPLPELGRHPHAARVLEGRGLFDRRRGRVRGRIRRGRCVGLVAGKAQ